MPSRIGLGGDPGPFATESKRRVDSLKAAAAEAMLAIRFDRLDLDRMHELAEARELTPLFNPRATNGAVTSTGMARCS
jgi:hypothetical protein